MLNSNMNYPYPILRSKPVDYKNSVFDVQIRKDTLSDGFKLTITYDVNNDEIKELIDKHILAYAIQLQCISTWYRDLEVSETSEQELFIPAGKVHERVDLCPCIVAVKKIDNFVNSDFTEDFDGISYEINTGEVVAIGDRQKFDAIYKNDIIKKGDPIVHFVNDENSPVMFCEWEYDAIRVHLPKEQFKRYNDIGQYEPWKVPVVNAIYVVPAIVQGINEIYRDEVENGPGTLEKYSWYKTLKVLIMKAAKDNDAEFRRMLSDPIKTTQRLLNDNSAIAMELVSNSAKQQQ